MAALQRPLVVHHSKQTISATTFGDDAVTSQAQHRRTRALTFCKAAAFKIPPVFNAGLIYSGRKRFLGFLIGTNRDSGISEQ